MTPADKRALYALLTVLLAGLRLINLGADPPSWLSWSSGIYTDEGIYAGDARSVVLFAHWSPGNFHSAEIAPLHHLFLLTLFRLFGVSLESARLLSVVTSLLTLVLVYLTVRRQFDEKTAVIATIFLGFSPFAFFYSRLALLETPAAFFLALAICQKTYQKSGWLSGLALTLAVVYKPLAILCVPAFFIDWNASPTAAWQRVSSFAVGLVVYFIAWQLPHERDLSRLTTYYLQHQYLPHSMAQVGRNLVRSLWSGSSDGILPYLVVHSSILLLLAVASLFIKHYRHDNNVRFYYAWLLIPSVTFCLLSYEPSRYFVLFWPALAVLAAITLRATSTVIFPILIAIFLCSSFIPETLQAAGSQSSVKHCGETIGKQFPATVPIVGQYAPELCLSNRHPAIYVQPGLANSGQSFPGDAILVTSSPYWNAYWSAHGVDGTKRNCLQRYLMPRSELELVYAPE